MNNEKLSFYIDKKIIYVEIERTINNNMYLKIKNNAIVVSANKMIRTSFIRKFVEEHIEKFVKHLDDKKKSELYSLVDNYIWISGVKLKITVLTGFNKPLAVVEGKKFYIRSKNGTNSESIEVIKHFLKEDILKRVDIIQRIWEKNMEIPKHTSSASYKNSSWASNSLRKQNINYSSKLSHYNDEIINYVVIHELAHYKVPNHSSSFWNIVNQYEPNYKEIRDRLKDSKVPIK
ncbi:YgjP-like metallopeptidase domain-containing protein [Candidatus Mycoplasma mahonii]|uniref:YgjP-like metallopeptidase domain-containing protein n=1 Tax=Candidatus Mycoplasma mahonii TaxID=3004105 RepID=UPI0026F2401D|nr:YgjP-like metallopeptidase domain-containing protein [Candidatus Mycoplasma mahonii]WKX02615.1 DUF45 domain-containing protein [Candidatus Mycoplasma mahonii]